MYRSIGVERGKERIKMIQPYICRQVNARPSSLTLFQRRRSASLAGREMPVPWQISHKLLFWRVWRFGNEHLGSSAHGHTTCPSRCLLHWMMWILWSARTNSQIINRSSGDSRVRSRLWSWGEGIAIVWWWGRGGGLLPIGFFLSLLDLYTQQEVERSRKEIRKEVIYLL